MSISTTEITGRVSTPTLHVSMQTPRMDLSLAPGGGGGGGGPEDAVRYGAAQALTDAQKETARENISAQELLVSALNIKTINGQSILGAGNLVIEGGAEMEIKSLSVSPSVAEMGSTVTAATLTYALSKVPTTLKLDNVDVTPLAKSGTISKTGSWTSGKTWTLSASDGADTVTKGVSLSFVNRVYYGAAATFDAAAIATKELSGSKARTFTVNAGAGQYIWYAVPKRLGTCSFKVGGFEGGFEAATEQTITNASGYSETYYVYRSSNAGLGATTVTVT